METTTFNINKVTEIQLVYKSRVKAADRPQANSSQKTFDILRTNWDQNSIELREEFVMLMLNNANRVLGKVHIGTGSLTSVTVDIKHIFATLLKANAASFIIAHNHPSGQIQPSEADKAITRKIANAGALLGIPLMDHLIITPYDGYTSFADQGLL